MSRWTALLLCCASLLALSNDAHAQRVMHRIRFGDSLRRISRDYYGDARFAAILAAANGLSSASKLRPGEHLRVPTAWTHTVSRRTSVKRLAKRLLGRTRHAVALRTFNAIRGRYVRTGTTVTVPFTLKQTARAGETFRLLSKRYYGEPTRAQLIARYNGLRGVAPAAGLELTLPIGELRLTARRLRQLVNETLFGIRAGPDRVREGLQHANGLLRRGSYAWVFLRLLQTIVRHRPSDAQAAAAFKLLAVAYVAFGHHEPAVRAFREALRYQPSLRLDPVHDSPKVIRAFVDAQSPATDNR